MSKNAVEVVDSHVRFRERTRFDRVWLQHEAGALGRTSFPDRLRSEASESPGADAEGTVCVQPNCFTNQALGEATPLLPMFDVAEWSVLNSLLAEGDWFDIVMKASGSLSAHEQTAVLSNNARQICARIPSLHKQGAVTWR